MTLNVLQITCDESYSLCIQYDTVKIKDSERRSIGGMRGKVVKMTRLEEIIVWQYKEGNVNLLLDNDLFEKASHSSLQKFQAQSHGSVFDCRNTLDRSRQKFVTSSSTFKLLYEQNASRYITTPLIAISHNKCRL